MEAPDSGNSGSGSGVAEQRRILKSLWEPHDGQRSILEHGARFRLVAAGRRWGKSEMAAHAALSAALETNGATVWWVSPSYDQSNEYGFDAILPLLSTDILEDVKRTKPRKITLSNRSTLSFRSAEREDSLRGGGLDYLVIDEAGSVPERAWVEELRPSLSDTLGDALMIGTPRGRNWFFRWWQRGQSADHPAVASWRAPTSQNPHIDPDEIESAREDMPERKFKQEYEAEFVDSTGGVFKNVRDVVADYALPVDPADADAPYSIGVDLARAQNFTAIVVLDAAGQLAAFDRLRDTSWSRIQQRVEWLAGEYRPCRVAVDSTRDNKIVTDLEDAGLDVEAVRFTASRKRTLIENLITRLEGGELTLSSDAPELINELEVFEFETTKSGNVRYSAPSGFHDDAVDALALAAEGSRTRPTKHITRKGTPAELARAREESTESSSESESGTRRVVNHRSPGGSSTSRDTRSDAEKRATVKKKKRAYWNRRD